MGTMTRLLMVLAAVFATASTSALAGDLMESTTATLASKAVQMTDEQLDEITAAGAIVVVLVSNPGNRVHFGMSDKKALCINCEMLREQFPNAEGTFVLLGVRNQGHPDSMVKCLGRCPLSGF